MPKRQAGYFGVKNMQYAMEDDAGGWGAPASLPFAKSLSLNALVSSAPLYADNRRVIDIPIDNGYEGVVGLTVLDLDYEAALGYSVILKGGARAQLDAVQLKKHCLYFETQGAREDNTSFTIKAWIYNMTTAKAGKNYTTKSDNIEFGNHEMPIVVYGTPLLDDAGEVYVDENGNERRIFIATSHPEDANYKTFGDAVPEPIAAAPMTMYVDDNGNLYVTYNGGTTISFDLDDSGNLYASYFGNVPPAFELNGSGNLYILEG